MLVQLYKGGIDNYGFRICIYGQHAMAHSRKRLCTVFQGPNSGCKSRHGAPVFIIHRIALNIRRSSLRLRTLFSVPAFANIGPIMAHFSSEMSCLLMEKQKQRTDEKSRFYLETAPSADGQSIRFWGKRSLKRFPLPFSEPLRPLFPNALPSIQSFP